MVSQSGTINAVYTGDSFYAGSNDNTQTAMYIILPVTPTWFDIRPDAAGNYPIMPFGNSNALETADKVQVQENVWRMIPSSSFNLTLLNSASQTLKLIANGGADWYGKRDFAFAPVDLQFMAQNKTPTQTTTGLIAHSATFVSQMNVTTSLVHSFKPASGLFTATTSVGAIGSYQWTGAGLVADVQQWVNSPAGNFGWIITGNEVGTATVKQFDTKEATTAANRPVLSVDFTPSQPGPFAKYVVNAVGGSSFTAGASFVYTVQAAGVG